MKLARAIAHSDLLKIRGALEGAAMFIEEFTPAEGEDADYADARDAAHHHIVRAIVICVRAERPRTIKAPWPKPGTG